MSEILIIDSRALSGLAIFAIGLICVIAGFLLFKKKKQSTESSPAQIEEGKSKPMGKVFKFKKQKKREKSQSHIQTEQIKEADIEETTNQ
jgi:hypothetical protein